MMRGDLKNRQGFCLIDPHGELYDAVVAYCARYGLERDIILLNLSEPGSVVGFNPFRRAEEGDVSVQVEKRITATLHAWNVENADQTPTLARTLRLIYTIMLEQNLGLPQVQHLINFNAKDIRAALIDRLQTPLIKNEWRELHELKARDWRDEILSAKNRLFKLLTSAGLSRFMGLPDVSINLPEIMDQGKVLLVNLKQSKYLSYEGARTFGALLVNEFFENALERKKDDRGRDPKPYYLYLDEFQNFVSLDIARMLAEVRKFGLFLILAHQYFEQLDEDITSAALNNCQIKAVFGGLSVTNARRMAEELFIGKLDPEKIKVAIHQTKFWPEYRRDKAYGHSSTSGSAHGSMTSTASASFSGSALGQSFYTPEHWFGIAMPAGTTEISSFGSTTTSSRGSSDMDSYSTGESEVDIPIFFPVPFQELSSIQYHSIEGQMTRLTAALKNQFQRHCFIQIRQQETQPMLVPFVEPVTTFTYSRKNLDLYIERQHQRQNALPAAEVDRLLQEREAALLQSLAPPAAPEHPVVENPPALVVPTSPLLNRRPVWDRVGKGNIWPGVAQPDRAKAQKAQRKRGPRPDVENHLKVAALVRRYDDDWMLDDNLIEICEALDDQQVPVPKTWANHSDGKARSWSRGFQNYPTLVIKAIKDRCKAAGNLRQTSAPSPHLPPTE
jgi:hypothetical protein